MARLRRLLGDRVPNARLAARVYVLLRRQARMLAEAGRDERPPSELLFERGPLVEIAGRTLVDVSVSLDPWTASQRALEILAFLERVRGLGARRLCEIGAASGGTLYLLTRVAAPDALLVSIDIRLPRHVRSARSRMGRPGQRIVSIEGDSHSAAIRGRVEGLLEGSRLDVLFIDGDHSHEGVRADFELYAPLVRSGGLIGLHDIRPSSDPVRSGDVPRYWAELSGRYRTEELVAEPDQDGYGIGLVFP